MLSLCYLSISTISALALLLMESEWSEIHQRIARSKTKCTVPQRELFRSSTWQHRECYFEKWAAEKGRGKPGQEREILKMRTTCSLWRIPVSPWRSTGLTPDCERPPATDVRCGASRRDASRRRGDRGGRRIERKTEIDGERRDLRIIVHSKFLPVSVLITLACVEYTCCPIKILTDLSVFNPTLLEDRTKLQVLCTT